MFDMMLHGLDDHDCVVHHDADRQDQPEQRQVVEAKAHRRHHGEGADDGHRHGHQRDDGRPPALEEQQDDHGHEDDRVDQGPADLVDRLANERRGVVDDGVIEPRRESFLQLFHLGPDEVCGLERIRTRPLVDRERDRRAAVEGTGLIISLSTEFDPGDVAEPDDPAVDVGLEDHVGKLLGVTEPAEGAHRVLVDLPCRDRGLADLAGRDLGVLLGDRVGDVGRGQVAEGHLAGVEPDPHAVVALAEVGDVADAREPGDLVAELDRRVVAQVEVVAAVVGREEVDDHQDARRLLLDRHTAPLDQVGEDRLGQRLAVLHEDLGHVQVDADPERDRQDVGAVVGALRRHVHHVLDAVHLLLDRRGDGVGDRLRVSPRVVGGDLDRRRRDLRVLRDGQSPHRQAAAERDDDREHGGEARPVDEEFREHRGLRRFAVRGSRFAVRGGGLVLLDQLALVGGAALGAGLDGLRGADRDGPAPGDPTKACRSSGGRG